MHDTYDGQRLASNIAGSFGVFESCWRNSGHNTQATVNILIAADMDLPVSLQHLFLSLLNVYACEPAQDHRVRVACRAGERDRNLFVDDCQTHAQLVSALTRYSFLEKIHDTEASLKGRCS